MVVGMAVYSVPAVIGYYITPFSAGRFFQSASDEARLLLALAWFVVGVILAVNPAARPRWNNISATALMPQLQEVELFLRVLLVVNLIGLAMIAFQEGPLFFLQARSETLESSGAITQFWRWTNVLGVTLALAAGKKILSAYFIFTTTLYFIAGDRTVIVITLFSVALYLFRDRSVSELVKSPRVLGLGVFAIFVVFFGKAFYLAIKLSNFSILSDSFNQTDPSKQVAGFEPLLVHGHLETVISTGFSYPLAEVVRGTLGQFLIVPSAFGIDSQQFNVTFTETNYPGITYGLAYSYWAEGYSVANIGGIALFSAILGLMIIYANWLERTTRACTRALLVLIGSMIAVYIYRNSLENLFVFMRQMVMVFIPIQFVVRVLSFRHARSDPQGLASQTGTAPRK